MYQQQCYSMRVWTDFGLGLGLGPQVIISLQQTKEWRARDLEVM